MKTQVKLISFLCLCGWITTNAQPSIQRWYDQVAMNKSYMICDMADPVKTADKGYILAFNPWSPNLHGPGPWDVFTIKTDSNMVPQWRKPQYCISVPLPTGGIILCYSHRLYEIYGFEASYIEKVTAGGTLMWSKTLQDNIRLNGGVNYGDKVRLVGGRLATAGMYPMHYTTSQPYTIEIDTMGNLQSQHIYSNPSGISCAFGNIERDPSGNFFVTGAFNALVLAKFNSNFSMLWAKYHSSSTQPLYLKDIDVRNGNKLIATGMMKGNFGFNYPRMGALLEFDGSGNIVKQQFMDDMFGISGLCRLNNGHYKATIQDYYNARDSVFILDFDTTLNVFSFHYLGSSIAPGTPIDRGSSLSIPAFSADPLLINTDLSGQNCHTSPFSYSVIPSTVPIAPLVLSAATSTIGFVSVSGSSTSPQSYRDSCVCGPLLSNTAGTVCAGETYTISANGTGTIHWYDSTPAGIPVTTGSTFTYAALQSTVFSIYAADASCGAQPVLSAASVTVHPKPAVLISPASATVCPGSTITFTATGAASYAWANGATGPFIATNVSQPGTLSVAGTNSFGCKATANSHVALLPQPLITVNSGSICAGESFSITPSGASAYSVSGGGQFVVSPSASASYSVIGINQSGCISQTPAVSQVIVFPVPAALITADRQQVCAGESVTLAASGGIYYHWADGTTAQTYTLHATQKSVQHVTVTNIAGCSSIAMHTLTVDDCTALTELSTQVINIFPNPAANRLNIQLPSQVNVRSTTILDVMGRVRLRNNKFALAIDISGFERGCYLLIIETGNKPLVERFVKE